MVAEESKKFVIDQEMFQLAVFIQSLELLRSKGLVMGGPELLPGVADAIVVIGRSMGLTEPSDEQLVEMADYTKRGGEWEKDGDSDVNGGEG